MRFDDFNKPEFANARYYIPTKSEWVIEPNDQVAWKSHAEIMVDIELRLLNEKPPMIWWKNGHHAFEKLFVVWW